MRTLDEFLTLVRESVALVRDGVVPLLTLALGGWAVHQAALQVATLLGGRHPWLAIIVFCLGVMANVTALALMLHVLEPRLWQLSRLKRGETALASDARVPQNLTGETSGARVVALALGPFLAVYALWGLVDEEIRALFLANVVAHGGYNTDEWSVNLSRWQGYLVIAVIAWVVKVVAERLTERLRANWPAVVSVLADGIFVFTSTLALVRIVATAVGWLTERMVWRWLLTAWRGFVQALPELRLPFDLTLPAAVVAAADWFWHTLLPAVGQHMLLPLMWLALAAVVFGWREITELQAPAALRHGRLTPVRRLASVATVDLREKYLPLLRVLGLALRSGPRFVGAYLVLATLVSVGRDAFGYLLTSVLGPLPLEQAVLTSPFTDLLETAIWTPLAICVYAAAFDRSLVAVTTWSAPPAEARWQGSDGVTA